MASVAMAIAVLIDWRLGEPRRWHPLIGFGSLAERCGNLLYGGTTMSPAQRRYRGVMSVALLATPITIVGWLLAKAPYVGDLAGIVLLYLALGNRSLQQHAHHVRNALEGEDLDNARLGLARIVSRDTDDMDASGIAGATIESVLENGNDAVFGALFWFALAGVPGVVLYRLANTLDAMWGYRSARYRYFGWAAARLDDVLNFAPARLTAITYALVGRFRWAVHCGFTQGRHWKSTNAGVVMAAGAGGLGVSLGGPAVYEGSVQSRPRLGCGDAPDATDIGRAVMMVNHGIILWIVFIAVAEALLYYGTTG